MKYIEYRGVEGFVIAEVKADTIEAYTTGEVTPFAGVSEIEKSVEVSSEAHYYDNIPAIVVAGEGADEIKFVTTVPDLEMDALVTGKTYDQETGVLIDTPITPRYFAVGYITKDTNGQARYVWRYKGTLSKGAEKHITMDDGTEANGVEWTYTGIHTAHKFTKTGTNVKGIIVEVEKGLTDVSKFFDEVTTPDSIKKAGM